MPIFGHDSSVWKIFPKSCKPYEATESLASQELQMAVESTLRQCICCSQRRILKPTILALYNPEADTKISADASSFGLGAVL